MITLVILALLGLIVGTLNIAIGGAGGIMYIGILTIFINASPSIATSTSLAVMIPTAIVGTLSHFRTGNINIKLGFTMLQGGIVGAIIGTLCAGFLARQLYFKTVALIMLYLSVQMGITLWHKYKKKNSDNNTKILRDKKKTGTMAMRSFGLMGGLMAGLTGLSGATPVVAGMTLMGYDAVETVATSVMVVLGIVVVGFAMRLGIGNVEWKLVGALVSGSALGAFWGPIILSKIDRRLLNKYLTPVFLVLVFGMGIVLLMK
jgi:uncharacterized protein